MGIEGSKQINIHLNGTEIAHRKYQVMEAPFCCSIEHVSLVINGSVEMDDISRSTTPNGILRRGVEVQQCSLWCEAFTPSSSPPSQKSKCRNIREYIMLMQRTEL